MRHSWELTGTRPNRGIYRCRNCGLLVESSWLPQRAAGEVWGGVVVTRAERGKGRPPCKS